MSSGIVFSEEQKINCKRSTDNFVQGTFRTSLNEMNVEILFIGNLYEEEYIFFTSCTLNQKKV